MLWNFICRLEGGKARGISWWSPRITSDGQVTAGFGFLCNAERQPFRRRDWELLSNMIQKALYVSAHAISIFSSGGSELYRAEMSKLSTDFRSAVPSALGFRANTRRLLFPRWAWKCQRMTLVSVERTNCTTIQSRPEGLPLARKLLTPDQEAKYSKLLTKHPELFTKNQLLCLFSKFHLIYENRDGVAAWEGLRCDRALLSDEEQSPVSVDTKYQELLGSLRSN